MKLKVGELVKIHPRIQNNSILTRLRKKGCILRLVEQDAESTSTGDALWKCAVVYKVVDEDHKGFHTLWLYEDELQRITDSPSLGLLLRE